MGSGQMRAAVFTGAGQCRIELVDKPEPLPGEVRVRLEGCGVCSSNLLPWSGPEWMRFPTAPGALGHEGWGVVDACGAGVGHIREGDRVAALFQNSYAEYDKGDAGAVIALPPELGDRPFPGEPLGCAMNIFARSGIEGGQQVAVVGAGFLGALLVQMAKRAGADVTAISRRPHSLETAKRMGADIVLPLDENSETAARDLTGGRLFQRVIEATGKQEPLDLAGRLTAERGRLVIAGYHQEPRQVNMQLWNWRGIDVINAHERDPAVYAAGVRRAVEAVLSGEIDPWPLFTHRFPLEEIGTALDMTRDRPDGFAKALVTT
ncbi:MAG: zinc-binding dehydrogenase [Nitratireductor sp.]|nr:zinc-binding dehydrogenase [Nitratireductor sp.]